MAQKTYHKSYYMFPVVVSRRALLLGSVAPLQTPKAPVAKIPYLKHAVILGSLATEIIDADRRDLQERAYLGATRYASKVPDAYGDPPFARDVLRSTLHDGAP